MGASAPLWFMTYARGPSDAQKLDPQSRCPGHLAYAQPLLPVTQLIAGSPSHLTNWGHITQFGKDKGGGGGPPA